MTDNKLKCYGCKFLHLRGSGYSNWTWLSTNFVCLKERFTELDDEPEGENVGIIERASRDCPHFVPGDPLETTPDGEIERGDKELGKSLGYGE